MADTSCTENSQPVRAPEPFLLAEEAVEGSDRRQTVDLSSTEQENNSVDSWRETANNVLAALGVVRDGLQASQPAVDTGFWFAQGGVNLGFSIGKFAASAPFAAVRLAGLSSSATDLVDQSIQSTLQFAQTVTETSMSVSQTCTTTSLRATDSALSMVGAENGQVLKMMEAHVQQEVGNEGYEVKEALLGLIKLLSSLSKDLTISNPVALLSGGHALVKIHQQHREERIKNRLIQRQIATAGMLSPSMPSVEELNEWIKFMRFSAAAYGYEAVQFLGIIPKGSRRTDMLSDKEMVFRLTKVPAEDLIVFHRGKDLYHPGYYISVLHESKQVIVAIRGTLSLSDVLVDLVCESEEFWTINDNGEEIRGAAHKGFLRSANRLSTVLQDQVEGILLDNVGYDLVVCGHSLGGGVSTLLTLIWARVPFFKERNIRGFSFASPCALSGNLSQASFVRQHITSVVMQDDVVSRLCLASFRKLQRHIVGLATASNSGETEALVELNLHLPVDSSSTEAENLFCGGRVWWLDSVEYPETPLIEIDPVQELHTIELFSKMFINHMPNVYVQTIETLEKKVYGERVLPTLLEDDVQRILEDGLAQPALASDEDIV